MACERWPKPTDLAACLLDFIADARVRATALSFRSLLLTISMTTGDHPASETETQASNPEHLSATDTAEVSGDIAATPPQSETTPSAAKPAGPLAKVARPAPLAARGAGMAKPASPSVSPEQLAKQAAKKPKKQKAPLPRMGGERQKESSGATTGSVTTGNTAEPDSGATAGYSTTGENAEQTPRPKTAARVALPNMRMKLSDDLQAELDAELAAADVEAMLSGPAGMPDRKEPLAEGTRVQGVVLKVLTDHVFIALGGPDEGMVPFVQFKEEPAIGSQVEVIVHSFSNADGVYNLGLPGEAVDVSDWEDIEEGSVVEATVTGANAGGLECKVGGVRGFIPISQIADYRVEDTSEFVDQKFLCVVNEANARRGNLVLSRRAILEREREEKRKEQLAKIEPGHILDGIVRSIKDFGAFVDLGGLDGLIHISKISWDRVGHPSEVVEVGQQVKVQIDKVDKETGKIGLSLRDTQENPWDTAEAEFAPGSIHKGTITRIAAFGCFVKLGPGVEGLVHISELANHRVTRVDAFVSEGQEVDVKVLTFDRDSQKVALSIKQTQAAPVDTSKKVEEEVEETREVAVQPMHDGPLKGGNNTASGGEKFGLRW